MGQLAFVAVVLVAWTALRALPLEWPRRLAYVPAYGIGSLAAFWFYGAFGDPRGQAPNQSSHALARDAVTLLAKGTS